MSKAHGRMADAGTGSPGRSEERLAVWRSERHYGNFRKDFLRGVPASEVEGKTLVGRDGKMVHAQKAWLLARCCQR